MFRFLLRPEGIETLRRAEEMVCNGRAELCDRKYGNVTFLGAHDSFAFSSNPLAREYSSEMAAARYSTATVSRTQELNLTQQLDLGARLLQAQSHM